jgi:hypothetical protein
LHRRPFQATIINTAAPTLMDEPSPQDRTEVPQAPAEPADDDTWSGWWRLLILAFVLLLAICGYWIAKAGAWGAVDDTAFQYLAILTILVGVCLGGRLTTRNFRRGIAIDRRTYNLSRSGWRMWWRV